MACHRRFAAKRHLSAASLSLAGFQAFSPANAEHHAPPHTMPHPPTPFRRATVLLRVVGVFAASAAAQDAAVEAEAVRRATARFAALRGVQGDVRGAWRPPNLCEEHLQPPFLLRLILRETKQPSRRHSRMRRPHSLSAFSMKSIQSARLPEGVSPILQAILQQFPPPAARAKCPIPPILTPQAHSRILREIPRWLSALPRRPTESCEECASCLAEHALRETQFLQKTEFLRVTRSSAFEFIEHQRNAFDSDFFAHRIQPRSAPFRNPRIKQIPAHRLSAAVALQ